MKTKTENFISMVRAVKKVVDANEAKWKNVKRFVRSVGELNDLVGLLDIVGTKARSPIKGATQDKYAIESMAMKQGVKLADRARVYARDQKDAELHEKLDITESALLRGHEDEALKTLMDVYEQLKPIVVCLNCDDLHLRMLCLLQIFFL